MKPQGNALAFYVGAGVIAIALASLLFKCRQDPTATVGGTPAGFATSVMAAEATPRSATPPAGLPPTPTARPVLIGAPSPASPAAPSNRPSGSALPPTKEAQATATPAPAMVPLPTVTPTPFLNSTVTIEDGKTIDFSTGKAVAKDSAEEQAIIAAAVKQMNEASKNITFGPPTPTPTPTVTPTPTPTSTVGKK